MLARKPEPQNGADDGPLADPIDESLNRRGLVNGEIHFDRVADPALSTRAQAMSTSASSQSTFESEKQVPASVLMPLKFKEESAESKKRSEPLGPRKQQHPYLETIRGPLEQTPRQFSQVHGDQENEFSEKTGHSHQACLHDQLVLGYNSYEHLQQVTLEQVKGKPEAQEEEEPLPNFNLYNANDRFSKARVQIKHFASTKDKRLREGILRQVVDCQHNFNHCGSAVTRLVEFVSSDKSLNLISEVHEGQLTEMIPYLKAMNDQNNLVSVLLANDLLKIIIKIYIQRETLQKSRGTKDFR